MVFPLYPNSITWGRNTQNSEWHVTYLSVKLSGLSQQEHILLENSLGLQKKKNSFEITFVTEQIGHRRPIGSDHSTWRETLSQCRKVWVSGTGPEDGWHGRETAYIQEVEQINKYFEDKGVRFLTIRKEKKGTDMKRLKARIDHVILHCNWSQCRLAVSTRDKQT